jgi:hypothetical protein
MHKALIAAAVASALVEGDAELVVAEQDAQDAAILALLDRR